MEEKEFNEMIESIQSEDVLLTEEEKQRLRDRYGIGSTKPFIAPEDQAKKTAEYSKFIYSLNDNSVDARANRLISQSKKTSVYHSNRSQEFVCDLPFDVVKEAFKNILIGSCAKKNKVFQVSNHSNIYVNMVRYAMRDLSCQWDLNKGILLFGNFGSGKTNALECLSFLEKMLYGNQAGFITKTSEEIMASTYNKAKGGFNDFDNEHLNIDDIGFNDGKKKIYGTEIDFKEFLSIRHRLFINTRIKTHATSNIDMLNNRKVLELFEGRLESRFNEMFNLVKMEGVDYRKV